MPACSAFDSKDGSTINFFAAAPRFDKTFEYSSAKCHLKELYNLKSFHGFSGVEKDFQQEGFLGDILEFLADFRRRLLNEAENCSSPGKKLGASLKKP